MLTLTSFGCQGLLIILIPFLKEIIITRAVGQVQAIFEFVKLCLVMLWSFLISHLICITRYQSRAGYFRTLCKFPRQASLDMLTAYENAFRAILAYPLYWRGPSKSQQALIRTTQLNSFSNRTSCLSHLAPVGSFSPP
jgi:hypothetical protein